MFANYPKVRPPLPVEIQEIYATHYRLNRDGKTVATSLAKKMESWMHNQVAEDVSRIVETNKQTLELGAGTLNQLLYEPSVKLYDVVEPFTELYENSTSLNRIRNVFLDVSDVPLSSKYARITSIATLEHVCNLPEVIARCGLILADNGVFRAGIPSEGTLLWNISWRITTGLEYKMKYGLDYAKLMKHEHVNSAKEIEEILTYFYTIVNCKVFGISKALSFYQFFECKLPNIKRCKAYLHSVN